MIVHSTDPFHAEGTIPRPDYKYPWVYVIQENDDGEGYVWGVYSQSSVNPKWTGTAATIKEARSAATNAPLNP